MRTAIAITLIICGTLLVAVPPLSDYMRTQAVVSLLDRPDAVSVSLAGRMSSEYRFGCFALGGLMMVTAIAGVTSDREHEGLWSSSSRVTTVCG